MMLDRDIGHTKCIAVASLCSLYTLWEEEKLCDSILVMEDGRHIPVHSAILCACSHFFCAAFTFPQERPPRQRFHYVKVHGVSYDVMCLLLNYVYLRRIDLTEDNVCDVWIAADYLGIVEAMEECCKYFKSILNSQNCVGMLCFARAWYCRDLFSHTWNYIMRNFVQIFRESEEIWDLPFDDFRQIVGSDTLNTRSEEPVWEAIVKWISTEPVLRHRHVMELMKCVRLGLLENQYFMNRVKDHPLVSSAKETRPVVIETLKFLYDIERILDIDVVTITPPIARPRLPYEVLFIFGGMSGVDALKSVETYDTRADRWMNATDIAMQEPRAYHASVVIGHVIYILGGFDGDNLYYNHCMKFDSATKEWSQMAPMNVKRCYYAATVLKDVIYAIGGSEDLHHHRTVETYDTEANQWSFIPRMRVARSECGACAHGNKVYVCGGYAGLEPTNSAECYDPGTRQWHQVTKMASRRSGLCCVTYDDHVYAVGGNNGTTVTCSGERYDPMTDTWTRIPDMYNSRTNFAMAVIDEMMFAIGGYNEMIDIRHVECYDSAGNEWFEATDLNLGRVGLSASVVRDLPFNSINCYIHQHREQLLEEKRQKALEIEALRLRRRTVINLDDHLAMAYDNIQQLNILEEIHAIADVDVRQEQDGGMEVPGDVEIVSEDSLDDSMDGLSLSNEWNERNNPVVVLESDEEDGMDVDNN